MAKARSNGPAQREALRGEKALNELWRQTGKPVCKLTASRQPVTIFDSHIGGIPFFIREADLLRRDFSRVGYYWHDNSDSEFFKLLFGPDWQPTARHKLSL